MSSFSEQFNKGSANNIVTFIKSCMSLDPTKWEIDCDTLGNDSLNNFSLYLDLRHPDMPKALVGVTVLIFDGSVRECTIFMDHSNDDDQGNNHNHPLAGTEILNIGQEIWRSMKEAHSAVDLQLPKRPDKI